MRLRKALLALAVLAYSFAQSIAGLIDPPVNSAVRQSIGYSPALSYSDGLIGVGSWIFSGSTYTGWGMPVGVRTNFDGVGIPIMAVDDTAMPTRILVVVREGTTNGTILATGTTNLSLTASVQKVVKVILSTRVQNTALTNIWLSYHTDGHVALYTIPVIYTNAPTLYWTDHNVYSPGAGVQSASKYQTPVYFYEIDEANRSVGLSATLARLVATDTVVSKIVTPQWGMTTLLSVGIKSTSTRAASGTISGWGQYVGQPTNSFNAVRVTTYAHTSTKIPSLIRVRVKRMPDDTNTWVSVGFNNYPVLSEGATTLATDVGVFKTVTVPLDTYVHPTGHIWVEWITDGYDGGNAAIGSGSAMPGLITGYTTSDYSSVAPSYVVAASHQALHMELGVADDAIDGFDVSSEFLNKLLITPTETPITLLLPNRMFARVGREANAYFLNFIQSDVPLEQQMVDVVSVYGKQYGLFGGFWRWVPTNSDVGTSTWSIAIRNKETSVAKVSKTASLITVATNHPGYPVTRRVLCVGDSTMDGSWAIPEAINQSQYNTNFTLLFVGSNRGSIPDATSVYRGVSNDAIAGWKATLFATNSTQPWEQMDGTPRIGSPFLVGGVLNIPQYMTDYGITLASNDWVLINLGLNPVLSGTSDDSMRSIAATELQATDVLINGFKSAIPGIRIGVFLTTPPNSSQDAFAADYGSGRIRNRIYRNYGIWLQQVLAAYESRETEKIFVWPYNIALDPVNGFDFTTMQISQYNTNLVRVSAGNSGVHPYPTGYYQLGDALYTLILGNE